MAIQFESSPEYNQDLARELCQAMNWEDLTFNDWFPILTALKSLGFSENEVQMMCQNSDKYRESNFHSQWKSANENYDISTIIGKAKIYAPFFNIGDFKKQWQKQHQSFYGNSKKTPARKSEKTAPQKNSSTEKENLFVDVLQARADINKLGTFRGLSIEILRKLNWGYSEEVYFPDVKKKLPAIIIPNDKGGVFARAVEGKYYRNNTPTATTTIFLPDADSFDVVIVEGAINGASILQAIENPTFGIIASGGTSGVKHVIEKIQSLRETNKDIRIIIAFDNDTNNSGQKAADTLLKSLNEALIPVCVVDITKTPDVDLNDILRGENGKEKLAQMVNSTLAQVVFEDIDDQNIKSLKDLPINLEIPKCFIIKNGKLIYNNDIISYTAPLVTKKYQQDDKVLYEVTFFVDNQWKNIIVSAVSLFDKSKLTALAELGLDANSSNAKKLCNYFVNLIGINSEKIPIETLYTQGGWTDDSCTEFIYPNDQKVFGKNFDYASAFKIVGDKEKFNSLLLEVLTESYIACLVVGVALAAPLIKPLSISNKQLHLGCRSGNGKTAIVKFAVALFGNPKFLMLKFNSTANALENFSVALNDFPSVIDELQSINKFQLDYNDDLLYNFENGRIRSRLTRQGNFQPFKYFRGCRITTGEQPLTNEYSNEGAKKRCVEISESKILREELAIKIHRLVDQNYGFYGRDWVKYIHNNIEKIMDDYNSNYDVLSKENRNAFAEHISLVAVAQVALKHFCILIFKGAEAQTIFDTFDVKKIFLQLPVRQEMQNGKRAIASVAELYSSHQKYFPEVNDSGDITTDDHAPYENYGYVLKNDDILIFPKVLRECLKEFPNFQSIIRDFSELGYLEEINDKKRPHQKSIKLHSKTIWGYVFKATELFDKKKEISHEEDSDEENVDEESAVYDQYSFEEED